MLTKQLVSGFAISLALACLPALGYGQTKQDQTITDLEVQLAQMMTERASLLQTRGDQHPQVVKVNAQILALQSMMNKMKGDTVRARSLAKRREMELRLAQLQAEQNDLKMQLGQAHPKTRIVGEQIDRWKKLVDKLPEKKQENESAQQALQQALSYLKKYQETESVKQRAKPMTKEEALVLESIASLMKAQRAAESKKAMELLLSQNQIRKQLDQKARDLDKAMAESQRNQDRLAEMHKRMSVEQSLIQKKNLELDNMQSQLLKAEQRLKAVQLDLLKRNQAKVGLNRESTSLDKKMAEMDLRMARMEKMLSRLIQKLDANQEKLDQAKARKDKSPNE